MKSNKVKKVFFWKLDDYESKYTLKPLLCQNIMHFTLIIKSVTTLMTTTCSTELKTSFFFHIIPLHCIIVGYEDDWHLCPKLTCCKKKYLFIYCKSYLDTISVLSLLMKLGNQLWWTFHNILRVCFSFRSMLSQIPNNYYTWRWTS